LLAPNARGSRIVAGAFRGDGPIFTYVATRIATAAGQPQTFVVAVLLILGWSLSGPYFGFSDTWQLIVNTATTVVTFLMVFIIQNSQNRDAAAMQAKLDEMLRAMEKAREQFIGIEHLTDRQIEDLRAALEREVGKEPGKPGTADDTVERLLERY
jgi:low affinity Fe/Cu permease